MQRGASAYTTCCVGQHLAESRSKDYGETHFSVKLFRNHTTIHQHQTHILSMEAVLDKPMVVTDMKKRLADIMLAVSWREFANTYFEKSSSWFYHKLDGIDGNGGKGGFSEMEALQLRSSLIDLSERIRRAADEVF